jgi:hypothetical protein
MQTAIGAGVYDASGAAAAVTTTSIGAVPTSRTVAGHALASNVTITASDVGAPSGSGTSSGTNTGDQMITLTGGVTGSGTGSFAATVQTNANLTGPITSVGNATSVASQTGTGAKFCMDTKPSLIQPFLSGLGDTLAHVSAVTFEDANSTSSRRFSISNGAGGNLTSKVGQLIFSMGSGGYTADPLAGVPVMALNAIAQSVVIVGSTAGGDTSYVTGTTLEVKGGISSTTAGSANKVVCWKSDGMTMGYATVAEITAGTCH